MAKINSWKADPSYLGLSIKIEPWGRYIWYRREFTNVFGSYSSKWVWIEGDKESKNSAFASDEIQEILDALVREHDVLGLFCHKYGIEVEVDA